MIRRFKVLGSIAVAMLFLFNTVQINAQEKQTNSNKETTKIESFSLIDETEFNYEEKLVSEGRVKYDIISSYEFTSLDKLPSSDEMYAIAYEQYPELINMNEDTYYLNFISGSSKKETRTTQAEMLQPNPYGSTTFNINGGSSIKVWKAPSSVSFSNVVGSVSGLTFATYEGKLAYCIEPGTYHGGGTLSSDPLSVALNPVANKTVAKWARSAEYYQSVDPNYWGEYLGVAQDKIWNVMGRTNTGSTVAQTYYDRVADYKNALDNSNVVTTNLPKEMYLGESYEVTVQYGKVYNHIQKLSNNFDIKLSNNSINSNKLDLRAVYTITPKSHGSFDIRFLSEPSGTKFSANYIYGSNQNLFVGRAIDPNMKQFNTQIIGDVEVGVIKVDSKNNPVTNVEIEFSTTEDFTSNVQKATTNEYGEVTPIKFQLESSKTEIEIYAREVSAPPQFVLEDTVLSKMVKTGEVGTFEFINNYRTLEIKKVDEDGNALAGAEIEVWEKIGNVNELRTKNTVDPNFLTLDNGDIIKYIDTVVTNEDGMIIIDNHNIKHSTTYYIRELTAPIGYKLYPDFIELEQVSETDEVIYFEFENTIVTNEIELAKVDEDGNALAGAELVVKDEDGNIIIEWTSTDKSKIVILDFGNYTYCETKSPNNYELNTECIKIVVDTQGEVQYKEIINYKKDETLVSTGFANTYLAISLAVLFICILVSFALGKSYEKKEEI